MITLLQTKDQSPTLYSSQFDQTYHSIHGAIAESQHVFINHGLGLISDKAEVSIFEMGVRHWHQCNAITSIWSKKEHFNSL